MPRSSPPPDLEQLVDLESQLERDRTADPGTLRARDRAIGRALAGHAGDRRALFLAWLERVRAPANPLPGSRFLRGLAVGTLVLVLLGLLLGWSAGAALFAFNGTQPVNAAHVLAVFVGIQLLLILFLVLAALPKGWMRHVPGASAVQDALRLLSPGRWLPFLVRVLPAADRSAFQAAAGRLRTLEKLYGELWALVLLRSAQGLGIAFNAGALLAALSLVAFTDLAFAWSTTLDIGSDGFHALTTALSLPWRELLPEAVPSRELVEATRYFRLDHSYQGMSPGVALDPVASAPWWRFLVAAMVVYGLLPRIAVCLGLHLAVRRRLARVRLDHAGYDRLHERLTEVFLETRAVDPETPGAPPLGQPADLAPLALAEGPVVALNWGTIPWDDAVLRRAVERAARRPVLEVLHAGLLDVQADARALERLRQCQDAVAVWILTKSYEAPTRDLESFLKELRATLGEGRGVVVMPVDPQPAGNGAAPDAEDLGVWTRRIQALGDPWLRVRAPAP